MNTFMGFRVMESHLVQPVPKIQVRDIRLSDGTPILSPAFLASENAWWRNRFGTVDVMYMMQDGFLMNPKHAAMLKNFV